MKKKINFYFVEQDGKTGAECSECGDRFFDQNTRPKVNGVMKAIEHAQKYHPGASGIFTGRKAVPPPPPSDRMLKKGGA